MNAQDGNDVAAHPEKEVIRICLAQAYAAQNYIRGAALTSALETLSDVSLSLALNTSSGIIRYWQAIRKLLAARKRSNPEIYILAFRGHELAWLVRLLTKEKIFVLDGMMSPYAALTEDRKFGWPGTILAKFWRPLENAALRSADAILTDTRSHSRYYQSEYGIPVSKLIVTPIGAIERPLAATHITKQNSAPFRVLFYGSFLPLHGMDVIVSAAAKISDLPIQFDFIGGKKRDISRLKLDLKKNGIANFTHRQWVEFDKILDEEIPSCDLCLGGPFGNTPQARRVITGKTHQAIALGKATVIGKIDEDCGFIDKWNCLSVEQGNPDDLADAIRWAYTHRHELPALGMRAQQLHDQRYSSAAIGARLREALTALKKNFEEKITS